MNAPIDRSGLRFMRQARMTVVAMIASFLIIATLLFPGASSFPGVASTHLGVQAVSAKSHKPHKPHKPQEPAAPQLLGGLDLAKYCRDVYTDPRSGKPAIVIAVGTDAYSWRCQTIPPAGEAYPAPGSLDLHSACVMQYGSGAYVMTSDYSSLFSWACYR